jgi:hypothetical protein
MRSALFLLATLACGGCGVDSTRAMWEQPWAEPGGSRAAYHARYAGEVVAKTALTPATVMADVATDPLTWQFLMIVAEGTLECCGQCCCH